MKCRRQEVQVKHRNNPIDYSGGRIPEASKLRIKKMALRYSQEYVIRAKRIQRHFFLFFLKDLCDRYCNGCSIHKTAGCGLQSRNDVFSRLSPQVY